MTIAELHKLPPIEKLKIIETLWNDLASDENHLQSPAWHETELRETERAFRSGHDEPLDWQAAKGELRREFE